MIISENNLNSSAILLKDAHAGADDMDGEGAATPTTAATQVQPHSRAPFRQENYQRDAIRLLKISPKLSPEGLIQCRLRFVRLPEKKPSVDGAPLPTPRVPSYVALSYLWGRPQPEHTILLNGYHVTVRDNLHRFLLRAREKLAWRRHRIWIDALCIDQGDMVDRNLMVSRMGEIYHNAKEVFVWLGDFTDVQEQDQKIDWPFQSLTKWRFHVYWLVHPNAGNALQIRKFASLRSITYRTLITWVGMDMRQWYEKDRPAVTAIADSSYWSRAWIVQEHLLARKRRLLFGHRQVSWSYVSNYISAVGGRASQNMAAYISNDVQQRDLARTLTLFGRRECSDPLDRIYAFAGLASSGLPFPVDYSCSPLIAMINTVSFCTAEISATLIRADRSLIIEWLIHQRRLAATLFNSFQELLPQVIGSPRQLANNGLRISELPGPCTYRSVTWPYGQYILGRGVVVDSIQSYTDDLWLECHGFHKEDLVLDCNPAHYEAPDEIGVTRSSEGSHLALIVRQFGQTEYNIVGSLRSWPGNSWALERYSSRGLPHVQAHLPPGLKREHEHYSIGHRLFSGVLHFTDVRPMMVLFGLPFPLSRLPDIIPFRKAAIEIIAQEARDVDYVPIETLYGAPRTSRISARDSFPDPDLGNVLQAPPGYEVETRPLPYPRKRRAKKMRRPYPYSYDSSDSDTWIE